MSSGEKRGNLRRNFRGRIWIFPAFIGALYGGLSIVFPIRTVEALESFAHLAGQIALPLGLVFAFMFVMNLFLSPEKIVRVLGKEAGIRGHFLSAVAGILSVGPIFAWYPLLKNLRERGASNAALATFLCNRAVKPFLIPVMISFFGWKYVLALTVWTITGAIGVGIAIGALTDRGRPAP